jgi:hexosaminidase
MWIVIITFSQFPIRPLLAQQSKLLNVVPSVQQWNQSEGVFQLRSSSRIVADPDCLDTLSSDLEQFAHDLKAISGEELPVLSGRAGPGDLHINLDLNKPAVGSEAYSLEIGDSVNLSANHPAGAFYGLQTLLQLFGQNLQIQRGKVLDYPRYRERGIMVDIGRKYFEIEYLEQMIRDLAWKKMNFIHLHFTDWHSFRLQSELFPGLAASQAYSKKDIRRIQDFASKFHVMVVPEIDLPAHATTINDYNPFLAFQCASMRSARWQGEEANQAGRAWILDVTRREVRSWIRALLDEWIPLFDAPYFHIGGDEWQYDKDKLACPELMEAMRREGFEYPGDLLVDWINETNEQIKSYGKITQIWNWWRFSPSQRMQNQTSIQPARDIIINVWNRPRLEEILEDGYDVIITSEEGDEGLYVTPFFGKKPGDYGYFNSKVIYEEWRPQESEQIRGFKVCLWTDRVEDKPDEWFDQHIDLPKAVLAERIWGGPRDSSIDGFRHRLAQVGEPPGGLR